MSTLKQSTLNFPRKPIAAAVESPAVAAAVADVAVAGAVGSPADGGASSSAAVGTTPATTTANGKRKAEPAAGEPRAKPKCGKCGQPKKGHTCTNPNGVSKYEVEATRRKEASAAKLEAAQEGFADAIIRCAGTGSTMAASSHATQIVGEPLSAGSAPNKLYAPAGPESSLLIDAALASHLPAIKSLLAKEFTDVNATRPSDGATALLIAARKLDFGAVKLLLQAGADPTICARGWRWEMPGGYEVGRFMAEIAGESVTYGRRNLAALARVPYASPLMVAAMTAHERCAENPSSLRGNAVLRALIFVGGLNAKLSLSDGPSGTSSSEYKAEHAQEALECLSSVALTVEEADAMDNDGEIESLMMRLLGFIPMDRAGDRAPWLNANERDLKAAALRRALLGDGDSAPQCALM